MSRKGADGPHLGRLGEEGQVCCADSKGVFLVLYLRRCAYCGAPFGVCPEHDRGHTYCSKACRSAARKAYLRRSRSAYQRSPEGRLDQRDRMRSRRRSPQARVMEHPSGKLAKSEIVGAAEHARDAKVVSVDLPAQPVDDNTSNVRNNRAGSEASSDLGADPAAAGPSSDSEPQGSGLPSASPVAPCLVGGAVRAHLRCIVCGRIGDRYLIRNVRGTGRRRGGAMVAGTGGGSWSRPIRC